MRASQIADITDILQKAERGTPVFKEYEEDEEEEVVADGFIIFALFTLYNIYDAGNFTTAKAFNLIGVDLNSVLKGADFSSKRTGHGSDSKADQAAITKGYNYNGVRWKK